MTEGYLDLICNYCGRVKCKETCYAIRFMVNYEINDYVYEMIKCTA